MSINGHEILSLTAHFGAVIVIANVAFVPIEFYLLGGKERKQSNKKLTNG